LRLSEHCTKMSKTINVILQHEKEQVNVWPKIFNGRNL
jgi:hypothetical protein